MAAVRKFRQFEKMAGVFLRFEKSFMETNDGASFFSMEVQKEEFKSAWEKVKTAYDSYLRISVDEEEEETASNLYEDCRMAYVACAALMGELSSTLPQPPSMTSTREPDRHQQTQVYGDESEVKLPPVTTEIFYGDYLSWPSFRESFQVLVRNRQNMPEVKKLFYLRQSVRGEALEIVKQTELSHPRGFELAWSNLKERYENKRVLVNSQLKLLFNLEPVKFESAKEIQRLQRDISNCVSVLSLHGIDTNSWDPIFVFLCSTKLPDMTLALWEQTVGDKTEIAKWSDLQKFLKARFQTLETLSDIRNWSETKTENPRTRPESDRGSNRNKNVRSYPAQVKRKVSCFECSGEHYLNDCPEFDKKTPEERFAIVKRHRLCINCFSGYHRVSQCPRKTKCTRCQQQHHILLHREEEEHSDDGAEGQDLRFQAGTSHRAVQNCFAHTQRQVLLGTAMVEIVAQGVRYQARALVDSGSQASFISENLQKRLNLPVKKMFASVTGINGVEAGSVQKECVFILSSSRCKSLKISVEGLVLPKLTGNLPSSSVNISEKFLLQGFDLADPYFANSNQVDVLIGGDVYPQILRGFGKTEMVDSLVAQETAFGWILTGPVFDSSPKNRAVTVSFYTEVDLNSQLERFWKLEEPPQASKLTPEDEYCEELYKTTVRRNSDGRYVVSLPFKLQGAVKKGLGFSRVKACRQFFRNEASLLRKPDLKEIYDNVLGEYEALGHMLKVRAQTECGDGYFLPHHAVFKPESSSTKVRVVFNASSRTLSGVSLNDMLYPGPVLQNDLTLLIIRWRFYRFVLNGDIEKMYRQILVEQSQRKYQRIVFRRDPKSQLEDFELQTVTFGVNCAPFLAIRTLLQLASDVEDKWPLASKILRSMMYVDDALVGTHDVSLAIRARDQLIAALSSAGFSMRKWASNDERILAGLPTEHLLRENFLEFEDVSSTKTLGIRWNAKSDVFYFVTAPMQWRAGFTKREVLSVIASLFDPAGWLGPIIVVAKMLMQQIWSDKTGWDECLEAGSDFRWKQFLSEYHDIDRIRIPRWVHFHPSCTIEVHGFADSSQTAYGACVYLRVKEGNGEVRSNLLVAKSRVAPLNTVSLPRLELCAALLLANLLDSIKSDLCLVEKQTEVFCWSDSTIVLAWLQKPPSSWNTFVANRVSKIVQIVGKRNWHHVISEDNPADLISRGVRPCDLVGRGLWWNGPYWLTRVTEPWRAPSNDDLYETEEECRKIQVCHVYIRRLGDILTRFSSYQKALRIMTLVFRVFARARGDRSANWSSELSASEIRVTKEKLIVISQKAYYSDEYCRLEKNEVLPARSSLLNLNPFLDEKRVMRANGRLVNAQSLSFNERCPIILPYICDFSRLLIDFIHKVTLHGANSLMLRVLRAEFWIPRAKNLIKTVIRRCKTCVVQRKCTQQQIMAALPVDRTLIGRPFTVSGVDFAGPYDIKNYTGRACLITKGYVCIFVCFGTKAVHLEAVSDLSSATFLAAFSRFVSRRGCPSKMYSDNGTNFVGASRALKTEFKGFLRAAKDMVNSQYICRGFSWHFNPAGAPHMGGLWEAGVKSLKHHLRRESGNLKYTFEEFSTLLTRIESCLNSRPLCPISENVESLDALTPGHFLVGGPLLAPPEHRLEEAPISVVNRWNRVKALNQRFCVRWKEEYLKELQKRSKWKITFDNLKVDDMVVIKEENVQPNEWKLGRVIRVCPGRDQKTRVVEVRTDRGVVVRPIVKLVLLP